MAACPRCRSQMSFIHQYGQWYCYRCKKYQKVQAEPAQSARAPKVPVALSHLWSQNFYRIRKKVLTVWNKYWIEDHNKQKLGFSKQKMFRLKEDIRVYSDESMNNELWRIKQQQVIDTWGTFAVIDSVTNTHLGYIKRRALSSAFVRDEYEVYDANNQLIGGIYEETGRGLARKYVPFGALIPEKMTFVLDGRPVAEVNQLFKIIGDIWELKCINVPQYLDRRVLLSGLLLMGMIERQRK